MGGSGAGSGLVAIGCSVQAASARSRAQTGLSPAMRGDVATRLLDEERPGGIGELNLLILELPILMVP